MLDSTSAVAEEFSGEFSRGCCSDCKATLALELAQELAQELEMELALALALELALELHSFTEELASVEEISAFKYLRIDREISSYCC